MFDTDTVVILLWKLSLCSFEIKLISSSFWLGLFLYYCLNLRYSYSYYLVFLLFQKKIEVAIMDNPIKIIFSTTAPTSIGIWIWIGVVHLFHILYVPIYIYRFITFLLLLSPLCIRSIGKIYSDQSYFYSNKIG